MAARSIGVHLLLENIDLKVEAMRQESQAAALVEDQQIILECGLNADGQIGFPCRMGSSTSLPTTLSFGSGAWADM